MFYLRAMQSASQGLFEPGGNCSLRVRKRRMRTSGQVLCLPLLLWWLETQLTPKDQSYYEPHLQSDRNSEICNTQGMKEFLFGVLESRLEKRKETAFHHAPFLGNTSLILEA